MTSVIKRWSQIDTRIKFFNALGDVSGFTYDGFATDSIVSTTDAATYFNTAIKINAFNILKDMGRTVTVVDTTVAGSPKRAIYRQIQLVKGALTEGVGGTIANGFNTFWIKVWADDGAGVARVARTG